MKKQILASLLALTALCFAACTSIQTYRPTHATAATDTVLGPVEAVHGWWPLALKTPPDGYTYEAALKKAAAKKYGVPEERITLSDITVKFGTELDGTIRDWKATATAAAKPIAL